MGSSGQLPLLGMAFTSGFKGLKKQEFDTWRLRWELCIAGRKNLLFGSKRKGTDNPA